MSLKSIIYPFNSGAFYLIGISLISIKS